GTAVKLIQQKLVQQRNWNSRAVYIAGTVRERWYSGLVYISVHSGTGGSWGLRNNMAITEEEAAGMKAQLEIAQERVVALEATNKRLAEHEMLRTTTPADTFVGRQAGGGSV
ncbi:unnamed protein product, partial [Pylaiella littoralis]